MKEYDAQYKVLASNRWIVQQLVEAFLDASVTDIMDLESLQMFPTESISKNAKSKKFKVRRNDVMWKIELKNGSLAYVLLMVEAQSRVDSAMVFRVTEYVLNWCLYLMATEGLEVLPLIVPMVIYNGDKTWNAATRLRDMIDAPKAFRKMGVVMDGGYILIDEKRLYESGQLPSGNIFEPLITALHTSSVYEFFDSVKTTGQMLKESDVNQEFIEHVNSFILDLKELEDDSELAQIIQQRGMQDMTTTIADFEQQLMERIERGKQEGRQEGKQEGMQKGKLESMLEFARRMLGDGEPEQKVRRYTELSSEEIRRIKREIDNSKG